MDLRVGDGVEQLPLLGVGEDDVAELLPVDLAALQQHLGSKVADDATVGGAAALHHWATRAQAQRSYNTASLL